MSEYKYAVLVDTIYNSAEIQSFVKEIISKPQYNVTFFSISTEKKIQCNIPIFNISEYFSWKDISIITSYKTLEKSIAYPSPNLKIILGKFKMAGYANVDCFDLDKINEITNEYYRQNN